jgi:hypothetical protein
VQSGVEWSGVEWSGARRARLLAIQLNARSQWGLGMDDRVCDSEEVELTLGW